MEAMPAQPLDYFMKYWPTDVLQRIILETNRYAAQPDFDEPHLTNGRHNWIDLTEPELLCWFGILILMGLKSLYNPERVCTVDEIMVPYKGLYCGIRQYMKSKHVRFGIKGLEHRGHTIVTDNFFTSIPLAMSPLARGFWCTGTVKKTSRGFPPSLAGLQSKRFGNMPPRGHLNVRMHRSRQVAAVCWVDNKPMWLLSTATKPVDSAERAPHWARGNFSSRQEFATSPILLEYQRYMRGVDVLDQMRQDYSVQLQSHKWWHRLFLFVLDTSC